MLKVEISLRCQGTIRRGILVKKPISPPPKTKPHSIRVLTHDFAYTLGLPPVTAPYSPPSFDVSSASEIVLEWSAACSGRQFDRIFGVWFGGAEVLRGCTAEPRPNGIVWTVRKDVTRYSSILSRPSTLAVFLGNVVDRTYTGVYHVNITLHFYRSVSSEPRHFADLILPVSRDPPKDDGLWFSIDGSGGSSSSKDVVVPNNSYRAVLEVFVSFHGNDEFWYTNPPNAYIEANNLTGTPGNGSFREVVVSIDGRPVGAVWPFTVIYTGGINPLLWRPITGIGSFDLPSYDIDVTPFLGTILDGKRHNVSFTVTDGLNMWFVDANLHLWLDSNGGKAVTGRLIRYEAPAFEPSLNSSFKGLDGRFVTKASRRIIATGWVRSSMGKVTTHTFQGFEYLNDMVFGKSGSLQIVNQMIGMEYGSYVKYPASGLDSVHVIRRFPLYVYTENVDLGDGSYSSLSNVSLGFDEDRFAGPKFGFAYSSLKNLQSGQGDMIVRGNLVTSGIGSTQQVYSYNGTEGCYFRNVSSSNYTILHDVSGETCDGKNSHFGLGHAFSHFPARRDLWRLSQKNGK
ncbi:hypothetical protein QJS10_CPB04g00454 [Acorus calamus]|uniref:Peptide N-acetyl-beta-D-glucosaminyl asparaginase amidase A N-terminal domain-containing protein n=1 Tax=Acorus calamus TaxID=4465 RepID=A0AAV9EYQ7_ACOCL|nr:hypothetical protein QJS10_CPB04g00454 [Acorus calamus]